MSSQEEMQTDFDESLQAAAEYPCNLVKTNNFEFHLKKFQKKLLNEDVILFDTRRWGKHAMTFFDYSEDTNSFNSSVPMSEQTGINQIKTLMPGDTKDPMCRFIFIHSRYSRDPLACSLEQLLYILSYLQAMPSIIDHVTTFCARDSPHLQTSVKVEDDTAGMNSIALATLGRSGSRLQHCFNLIGIEHDASSKGDSPYLIRQTAAYFTFDLVSHRCTWIVFKANEVVKERIHQSAKASNTSKSRRSLNNHDRYELSLSSALNTHILIFEWCIENWADYMEWLEERLQRISAQVKSGEVKNLTSNNQIAEDVLKKDEFHAELHQKRSTGLSDHSMKPSRASSFISRLFPSKQLQSLDTTVTGSTMTQKPNVDEFDFGKRFPFEKLQSLHRLSDKLEEACLAVNQNMDALAALRTRFTELQRSHKFKRHMKTDPLELSKFLESTQECIQAMKGCQSCLQSMSSRVNQDIFLFRDMRINEFFLHQTKILTDIIERLTVEMADIAVKTRHETNLMYIITIFTLIFLPGTFVATFFSSGILDFDNFDGNLSMINMVGFNTKWAALKLFGVICLPLMGATLSVWALVYFLAWKQQQRKNQLTDSKTGSKDLEKGTA